MRHDENVWIPLGDGTRLAARIWRPVDSETRPVPAVLEYLPYRKSDATARADERQHRYFAGHGYAAIRVDLRGTGDSDGLIAGEYLPQEHEDALEVLRWLAGQPWCTGDVGMIGYSWGGFNGLQIAALRPPELRAVITHASTDDRYRDDCHYMGGCLLGSDMLKWASTMLAYTLQPPDRRFVGERWREMWLERLRGAPALARDWVSHQRRDAFWKQGSVAEDYSAIACPVLVVGGWADAYTNAVPRLLENLTAPRRGIIGPWGHMMPQDGVPGPAIGFLQEALRWWDRWLKGAETGVMDEPLLRCWMQEWVEPRTYHAERPGRWVAVDAWPPLGLVPQTWHPGTGGGLSATPSEAGRTDSLTISGAQECGETAGVWCANGHPDEIAGDQRPDDERSLTFTSEPLDHPVEVLGVPTANLLLASDRANALVAVRLCDVAPDGSSLLVSWGLRNLTHDVSHEDARGLAPGRISTHEVRLRVCGHRFDAGHRIRLAVSPTYWPHAWPSPEVVTLTLVADECSLVIPVSPPGARRPVVHPFDEPEAAAGVGGLPEAVHDRTRSVNRSGGLHTIEDRESHEQTVRPGVTYQERMRDRYTIRENDPLSARVMCEREVTSTVEGGAWTVHVVADMWCTDDRLIVAEEFAATADGAEVFRCTRSAAILRDHV